MNASGTTKTMQYLTFKLDDEVFALDIADVREVLDFTAVTKVPQTPRFMRGVINLRGNVVPVVDLRTKFSMPPAPNPDNMCIIIVEVTMEGEQTVLGALADSVQEVLDLDETQIEPAPRLGTRLKAGFIKGMGKRDDQLIIILDMDRVFSMEELILVNDSSSEITPEQAVAAV